MLFDEYKNSRKQHNESYFYPNVNLEPSPLLTLPILTPITLFRSKTKINK